MIVKAKGHFGLRRRAREAPFPATELYPNKNVRSRFGICFYHRRVWSSFRRLSGFSAFPPRSPVLRVQSGGGTRRGGGRGGGAEISVPVVTVNGVPRGRRSRKRLHGWRLCRGLNSGWSLRQRIVVAVSHRRA